MVVYLLVLVLLPPHQTLLHSTAPPPPTPPPDMEFFYSENKERFLGALAQEVNRGVRHLSHLVPLFGEGSGNGIPLLSVSAKVFCVRLLKISFVFPFSLFKAEPVQKKTNF